MTERERQTWKGLAAFVALTFGMSWGAAWLLNIALGAPESGAGPTRLFMLSLTYAAAMGWQPIFAVWAVRRWVDPPAALDHGLIPAKRKHIVMAAAAGITLVVLAALLAWVGASLGWLPLLADADASETGFSVAAPNASVLATLAAAFVGTLLMLWVQAFAEEIGWRGYFLSRLMRNIGPWRGLCLHGLVWGIWYAPIMLFAGGDLSESLGDSGAFVVTCVLLGVLLGWVRLASKSVVPATVANVTMTLAVGLPYVINGIDSGIRGALFGPAGWCVMVMVALLIAATRLRSFVRVPSSPAREVAFHFLLVVDRRWWIDRRRPKPFELN